jgi:hypothetical protein
MSKSRLLPCPLKDFKIPIVSWRPNSSEFHNFQVNSRITYTDPEKVDIKGYEWYLIRAKDVNNKGLGGFFLPLKYYGLWRRLVYGALYQEKMYEAWIIRTARLKKKKLSAIEEEEIRLKNVAGVRFVQYLLCRRLVLEELKDLQFGDPNSVVPCLIEFGIRDSRDWMFETFENAKIQGRKYLRLDPTAEINKAAFGE